MGCRRSAIATAPDLEGEAIPIGQGEGIPGNVQAMR